MGVVSLFSDMPVAGFRAFQNHFFFYVVPLEINKQKEEEKVVLFNFAEACFEWPPLNLLHKNKI